MKNLVLFVMRKITRICRDNISAEIFQPSATSSRIPCPPFFQLTCSTFEQQHPICTAVFFFSLVMSYPFLRPRQGHRCLVVRGHVNFARAAYRRFAFKLHAGAKTFRLYLCAGKEERDHAPQQEDSYAETTCARKRQQRQCRHCRKRRNGRGRAY